MPRGKIDVLLNLVPDAPSSVLEHLASDPALATAQDAHGYSLLHAAASYGHEDLVRTLVNTYAVPVDIVDEDRETPLFAVETVDMARALLALGADTEWRNAEGLTAEEKIEGEGEWPLVAAFLRSRREERDGEAPEGVKVDVRTVEEQSMGEGEVDPEFRRRIEELAAREDFQSEDGQRQLRELITDAVMGLRSEGADADREVRRRVE
ncbi:hypothetical protein EJ06DRAFT_384704 [Trichodelitschia bisporula]|uniref:Uncharacterized protein n=1 Tax=Trichodelitschia bisporula TaxID=703511 RepID=A0A6G1HZI4_9PEZI|nr:hypothetical protein EJ06DRAFT_384704 [Trichodelitschia bisporula]